jgi:cytidine deaminase
MKQIKTIDITFEEFDGIESVPEPLFSLFREAEKALPTAYAPYSRFRVAAAVLMDDGSVVIGTNQENMAYPSGLCAERVALFAASAGHPGKEIKAIALTVGHDTDSLNHPVAPCGACRQVMLEYELKQNRPIRAVMAGRGGKAIVFNDVKSLLPLHFFEEVLKGK